MSTGDQALGGQLATGRVRKGQETDLRRTRMFQHMRDERHLDAAEQIILVAEQAGLKLTHMAIAFAIRHPGVISAIIGPRTMEHLDDLLAGGYTPPVADGLTSHSRWPRPTGQWPGRTWRSALMVVPRRRRTRARRVLVFL
jgi:Aldo/keto reductase family